VAKERPKLTKEQKVKQQIIDSIRTLTDYKKYTLGQIEKILGIPQNTLSGMLSGSRNMAPKWQRLLSEFIKALPKEDKTITIKIDQDVPQASAFEPALDKLPPLPKVTISDLAAAGIAITKVSENATPKRIDPGSEEGQKVIAAFVEKTMPPGLTKAQQIRWYRENSQTLR
jgi:hypothetical protein